MSVIVISENGPVCSKCGILFGCKVCKNEMKEAKAKAIKAKKEAAQAKKEAALEKKRLALEKKREGVRKLFVKALESVPQKKRRGSLVIKSKKVRVAKVVRASSIKDKKLKLRAPRVKKSVSRSALKAKLKAEMSMESGIGQIEIAPVFHEVVLPEPQILAELEQNSEVPEEEDLGVLVEN